MFRLFLFFLSLTALLACGPLVQSAFAQSPSFHNLNVIPQPSWQSQGFTVKAGRQYLLAAKGSWSYGLLCGPADANGTGNSFLCEANKVLPGTPAAALIARLGEKGKPFQVGSALAWTAPADGLLQFSPNAWDPLPGDNSGQLAVTITPINAPVQAAEKKPVIENPQPNTLKAETGPRIALVIGNAAYQSAPLANPANDAKLMIKTLGNLGFTVLSGVDVDQKRMKLLLREFGQKLDKSGPDAVGLFFYAGHGLQVGGRNYLLPVDAAIESEADVDIEAVPADNVLSTMAFAGNRLNFVVLDACRNNPFKRSFRSAARGLARMDAARGTLIAYATSPGDVALDGSDGNSPYTAALARALNETGMPVEKMFRNVRNSVMAATGEKQIPWESSSLTGGDFYFKR